MSGEERLPEERWRRVGVSGSLRGRRSEEMTQSNTFSPRGGCHSVMARGQLQEWGLLRALNLERKVVSTLDGPIWSRCSIVLTCPVRSHFQRTQSKERWGQGWDERYRSSREGEE